MARFFDPKAPANDKRLHAPATARNRDVIFDVLKPALPKKGLILELASGTGEHAAHMAPKLPNHRWQPSDIEPHHLESINAWRTHVGASNIHPAKAFNVLTDTFDAIESPAAILAVNLIHIAPWSVAETLISKAGTLLGQNENGQGILFLYGPYKQQGQHTSPSNEAFDRSLKANNPLWGVRDMETVIEHALKAGFTEPTIKGMPANNFSLIFTTA